MEKKIHRKSQEQIERVMATKAGAKLMQKKGKKVSTRMLYAKAAELFSEYLGKGLDDIVDEYQTDVKDNLYKAYEKWEEIFSDFGDYLEERYKGTSPSTLFAGAKALINVNVPKSLQIKPEAPKAKPRTIPPIPIDDLRFVRDAVDERERAFIDFFKDTGMSMADALEMNYGHIKKAIEDPAMTFFKIRVYRAKESVEYETWLGPNSIHSLQVYFTIRHQRGENIIDETPIFASNNQPYERLTLAAVSELFVRIVERTGKVISSHRLRKFFETYIAAGGVHPIVAKYWMGHKVRTGRDVEGRYIIPPENLQREMYEKAYKYIDLTGDTLEERAKQAAREELQKILSPEERELMKKAGFQFRKIKGKAKIPPEDCQKIIAEEQLEAYLNEGWRVQAVLPSGKIVVSNE